MYVLKRPGRTDQIRESRITKMIDRYKSDFPLVPVLIRKGYSAERTSGLAGCEVWVAKMVKFSGRF